MGRKYVLGSGEESGTIIDLDEAIAGLGKDGWEMISHTPVQVPAPMEIFYFKRSQ